MAFFVSYIYTMRFFYKADITGKTVELSREESVHVCRVLRMREGEALMVSNGKGTLFTATLVDANQKAAVIEMINAQTVGTERSYTFNLAIAPTKQMDRIEWVVEKAVEIGVDSIVPILTANCERKHLKIERLERIAIAALKQSRKAVMPIIEPLITFDDFLLRQQASFFIAHCHTQISRKPFFKALGSDQTVTLAIGPEGDFTEEEVNAAEQLKGISVSLGRSRLRTETAAIVGCHTVNLFYANTI